jgi:hypothetical protein
MHSGDIEAGGLLQNVAIKGASVGKSAGCTRG